MKEKMIFIEELLGLIQELNVLARERKVFDPLSDTGYSIKINYPYSESNFEETRIEALHIKIDIVYSSGGGEESAYIINDTVCFILKDNYIMQIFFERESNKEEVEDIELREPGAGEFIKRIRRFCEKVLPSEVDPL